MESTAIEPNLSKFLVDPLFDLRTPGLAIDDGVKDEHDFELRSLVIKLFSAESLQDLWILLEIAVINPTRNACEYHDPAQRSRGPLYASFQ